MGILRRPRTFNTQLTVADIPQALVSVAARWVGRISLITDLAVLLQFDGDGSPAVDDGRTLTLLARESYSEEDIDIMAGITFLNLNPGERPRVRGIMWGREDP